jgi:hypothetical protein
VRLAVFSLVGEEVAVLVDANQTAGRKSVVWNGGGHVSGMYLYRLDAGGVAVVRKLLLVK